VRVSHILTVSLIVAAIALAKSPSYQDQVSKLSDDDLARGKQLFVAHCALCHGIGGAGDRGPALNQPKLSRASDNQALFRLIKNGIQGTEMPEAWQMTDREIWQVAGYVRAVGRTPVAKLPGDPAKGKVLYESKGVCASCHIVQGRGVSLGPELTDVGAKRSPAYLRQALLDPGASAPERFLVVKVITRDGQTVTGIRANEDSFTIQLRDQTGSFHSYRKAELTALNKESGASLMPSYARTLTDREIEDLVAYLASLRGEQ
jgi:putative heme-binding domain-containing protein